MTERESKDTFPKARPSASADASRAAELSRLRAMSVEERMRLALKLQRQLDGLKPQRLGS